MSASVAFDLFFSALALIPLVMVAREAVLRLTSGPVRFRLAHASQAGWLQTPAYALVVIVSFLLLLGLVTGNQSFAGSPLLLLWPMWALWTFAYTLSLASVRRHAKRWLVLGAGLLSLVMGAVFLALALRSLQTGEKPPYELPSLAMLLFSVVFFTIGAVTLQEHVSGTRVRERGIEMFSTTFPWSRVCLRGWHLREGGFDLYLSVRPFRLVSQPSRDRDSQFIVPVPAAQRPALEAFLTEHSATAG
jgi:hypothetical protein